MNRRAVSIGRRGAWWTTLFLWCSLASAASGDQDQPFRVCADPDNLPYSNRALQGFENKIAEVMARDLGASLSYYWWPHQRGLVRNTLGAGACDVIIGIPRGYDLVLWTRPYYRSTYAMTYRGDRNLDLHSLDDPALKGLRIGVYINTPPYSALGNRGLGENLVLYRLFFDPRDTDPAMRPQKLIDDVLAGVVDVAVAWGPLVGYLAKQHENLRVVPLDDDASVAMSFEFSMGVKKGAQELKARLEEALLHRQAEIQGILNEYGVPLLPLKPPPEPRGEKASMPASHQHGSNRE